MKQTTHSAVGAPPLAAEDVVVAWRDAQALGGVTLTIRPGEIYALVGPNGAGKSTFVKAVCGRVGVQSGRLSIGGAPAGSGAARRRIGVAPQRPALFDRLTALENVSAFARLSGVPAAHIRARAADCLGVAGLDPASPALAHRLSGGQRQRINIAAAVVHAPALVVLDEPAAALDRAGVDDVNALIARLAARGVAVLLVTHDMAQAELLATRVGVLNRGSLVAEAAPSDLRRSYAGDGLSVSVTAPGAGALLGEIGFAGAGAEYRWRGRLPDHRAVAALAERLDAAGSPAREIDIAAPTLGDAIAALLAERNRAS